MSETHSLTNFVNAGFRSGHDADTERLAGRIVDELRKIAGAVARRDPLAWRGVDLDEAVNEVYVRFQEPARPWNDRKHFYRTAALAIRFLRWDSARRRHAMHLDSEMPLADARQGQPFDHLAQAEQVLRLNRALERLAEEEPEAAQVLELYFFGVGLPASDSGTAGGQVHSPPSGLTCEQIGELLGLHKGTVSRLKSRGLRQLRMDVEEGRS